LSLTHLRSGLVRRARIWPRVVSGGRGLMGEAHTQGKSRVSHRPLRQGRRAGRCGAAGARTVRARAVVACARVLSPAHLPGPQRLAPLSECTGARANTRSCIIVRSGSLRLAGRRALPEGPQVDLLPRREGTCRNGSQPTADALLTMRSERQLVAASGNGLALVQAIFRPSVSRMFATGCAPLFHSCSIPIGPKTRALARATTDPGPPTRTSSRTRRPADLRHRSACGMGRY
jgi:hypothetical protein